MRKNYFLILLISSCLLSCSDSKKTIYSSSIDDVVSWGMQSGAIQKGEAHSGSYYTLINGEIPYSLTFQRPLIELSEKQVKKIRFQTWGRIQSLNSDVSLICSLESPDTKIMYLSEPFAKHIKKADTWTLIQGEATLPEKIPANAILKLYIWSSTNSSAQADDFEIELIY